MKKIALKIMIIMFILSNSLFPVFATTTNSITYNYFKLIQKDKIGLLNSEGEIVIQPKYQDISYGQIGGMLGVENNGKWGFVDTTFKEVIKPTFDEVFSFYYGWCPVRIGKTWGIIDTKGAWIVKPAYASIDIDYDSKYAILKQNGKSTLIDGTGRFVISKKYDSLRFLANGLLSFVLNKKTGIIDNTGKLVLSAQYDDIWNLNDTPKGSENFFTVEYNKKTSVKQGVTMIGDIKKGLADNTGKVIIPANYSEISYFAPGLIELVDYKYGYGLADTKGKLIFKPVYKNLSFYQEDEFIASKDGIHFGVINKKGLDIIKPIYTNIIQMGDNLLVNVGGKWSFGPPASMIIGGKWGIIDKSGNELLPAQYENATCLGNFASFQKNKEYGIFNSEGKVISGPQFSQISYTLYRNGPCLVRNFKDQISKGSTIIKMDSPGSAGFIDETGQPITPTLFPFDNASDFNEGMAAVEIMGKWGFIDTTGSIVIPCQYESCNGFSNGVAWVLVKTKDGKKKYGLINKSGKYIYTPQFNEVLTNNAVYSLNN